MIYDCKLYAPTIVELELICIIKGPNVYAKTR